MKNCVKQSIADPLISLNQEEKAIFQFIFNTLYPIDSLAKEKAYQAELPYTLFKIFNRFIVYKYCLLFLQQTKRNRRTTEKD